MKWIAIGLIKAYQLCISPLIGPISPCRFIPSCSQYALEAIQAHGFFYGCWLAAIRLVKCGPWHPGGIDNVQKCKNKRRTKPQAAVKNNKPS